MEDNETPALRKKPWPQKKLDGFLPSTRNLPSSIRDVRNFRPELGQEQRLPLERLGFAE